MAQTMDSLQAPAPTWGSALQSYEREKRRTVDVGLVCSQQLRLSSGQLQVQARSFDPLLQRFRDHTLEAQQRTREERERVAHLNRAQDIQILREQPFHIITHESKLEAIAPGADPTRLGGRGTLGEKPRTKENRSSYPDTTLDYNILSNLPYEVHHWARPEDRPLLKHRSPKPREVPAFTLKDYHIISNRYLEGNEEKQQRDKQLNLLEATDKYMKYNRFDPLTQQFADPRHEERARACQHAREVETQLRAEALQPPSMRGRQTAAYGLVSHEATDPEALRMWDAMENERKSRYRARYNVEQRLHSQEIREEKITEARTLNRVAAERYEEVKRRGYDIIDNRAFGKLHKEKVWHEPRAQKRPQGWLGGPVAAARNASCPPA